MTDEQLIYAAYLEKIEKTPRTFPAQDAFISDTSSFLFAQCSRRAGKTNGLAIRFHETMKKYPRSLSRYIALTHGSAEDIMWPVLKEMDDLYGWNAIFHEADLSMTIENGAKLKLIGADSKNFIKRLKGAKSPAIGIDEAQDFGPHLQSLIDDVLTPTMADYADAWLALCGTPGPIPRGTFFDITHGNIGGYSSHMWTIFDNPYLPNSREFVQKLKERNKWDDLNPTYLREWMNRWVLDLESLLIKYDERRDHYDNLPQGPIWQYIMGVDLGVDDADAIAILAWSEQTPVIYLIEELLTRGQDISQLSEQILQFMNKYDIGRIVMDEGALGKKVAEEIRRRKQIPVEAADKARKMENVAFLNDYMRIGKFKAKRDSQFAQDSQLVQIDWEKTTPDRLIVKKGFHSDIIDAVLYAFKESPAYTFEEPKVKAKAGTQEYDDDFANDLFQHNLERLKRERENRDNQGFNWNVDQNGVPEWNKW